MLKIRFNTNSLTRWTFVGPAQRFESPQELEQAIVIDVQNQLTAMRERPSAEPMQIEVIRENQIQTIHLTTTSNDRP